MPRYHFNVYDGVDMPDPVGMILPDLAAAREQAIRQSAEILKDGGKTFWKGEYWTMEVCDGDGTLLFSLHFSATAATSAVPAPRQ